MFSIMGNCISCIKRRKQPKRSVTLALLGLDSAGKTTTTNALLGETLDTAPTIGFNREEIEFKNYAFTLYDLGGGRKIRDIWKDYFSEVYGLIYVVDSSTRERVPEVRDNLKQLLQHKEVRQKPLLILGNKQDLPDHMEEVDLMEGLDVESVVNLNKCPCRLELCSAIQGSGKKMDPNISTGMTWMCNMLDQMFDQLKERVDRDTEIMQARKQKEKEERKERVRLIREERERKEAEEKKRLGIEEEEEEEEDDIVVGDPFRKLTAEEMQRKEEKYKKTKAKNKERQKKLQELNGREPNTNTNARTDINDNDDDDDDDDLKVPRSTRSVISTLGLGSAGIYGNNRAIGADISPRVDSQFSHTPQSRQLLPPLQTRLGTQLEDNSPRTGKENKKKKTKKSNKASHYDDGTTNLSDPTEPAKDIFSNSTSPIRIVSGKNEDSDVSDEEELTSAERGYLTSSRKLYMQRGGNVTPEMAGSGWDRGRRKKTQNGSDGEEGFDTLRLSQHMDDVPMDMMDGRIQDKTEERSVTPVKKLKKKKRTLRKNKTHPSDEEEFDLSDAQSTPRKQGLPWVRSPSPKKMLDTADNHTNSWRISDGIQDVESLQPVSRSRPNVDSEDDLIL